jgi:cytochrome c-type biogenesis protein CcmH/NrfF
MRDPRNWARPAVALVAGGAAGTALMLLRARRRAQTARVELESQRRAPLSRADAERALRELGEQARRIFRDR